MCAPPPTTIYYCSRSETMNMCVCAKTFDYRNQSLERCMLASSSHISILYEKIFVIKVGREWKPENLRVKWNNVCAKYMSGWDANKMFVISRRTIWMNSRIHAVCYALHIMFPVCIAFCCYAWYDACKSLRNISIWTNIRTKWWWFHHDERESNIAFFSL